ncbi:MAG: hypothetical protein J6C40_04185 [Lentisphaeria bacterium]|nr:hypothetical protein [Lentisphaeria bacterium]
MSNAGVSEKYTAIGDAEAEELLKRSLSEIGERLSGSGLSVYLGGSYGRGDGGVRQDRENGILYNDLDLFVFARKKSVCAEKSLKEIAGKYEHLLKVDVDFSSVMNIRDIKKNAGRLMMQELKRGYRLVCGEDLLEKYLPEIPAEKLPFSEACRLLLNRGMGLLLAGEKIAGNSPDHDFILRNINKAVLGAGDAVLISRQQYKWSLSERPDAVRASDLPGDFKELYAAAVEFKKSPRRNVSAELDKQWRSVRDMFIHCMAEIGGNNGDALYRQCESSGEVSLKNFMKYCVKCRTFPESAWKLHTAPAVAVLLPELYRTLKDMHSKSICSSKLYRQWLIFN